MSTRELHSFTGPYWALPAWVEFTQGQTDVAKIRVGAGVRLLDLQRTTALERLQAIGGYRANGKWWLGADKVGRYFTRHPDGTDPELLVEWRPWFRTVRYREDKNPKTAERTRQRDEFFAEFVKTGWIKNPYEAEILFTAFMTHAMHWLLNEGKAVDFVFFELSALPVRPNWKELVHFLYSQLSVVPTKNRGKAQVNMKRLVKMLSDTRLSMFNTEHRHIDWSLDVRPNAVWERFTHAYELTRKRLKNNDGEMYAGHVNQTFKARLPQMLKIYEYYLSQVRKPYLCLGAKRVVSDALSPQDQPERKGELGKLPQSVRVPIAYDHRTRTHIAGVTSAGGRAGIGVPPVPDIRPEAGDVRGSGEDDVDASGDQEA